MVLFFLLGFVLLGIGIIALIKGNLKMFRINNRGIAAGVLLLGFVLMIAASPETEDNQKQTEKNNVVEEEMNESKTETKETSESEEEFEPEEKSEPEKESELEEESESKENSKPEKKLEVDRKVEIERSIKNIINERDYSNAKLDRISINKDFSSEQDKYIALVNFIFDIKNTRETGNEVMKMYSDDLVATLSNQGITDISEAAIFWQDDYNNRNVKYAYEYRNGNFYIVDIAGE